MKLRELLTSKTACDEAVEWAGNRPVGAKAWRECARGDWMLWIAARLGVDRKLLVLAACACARTALRFLPKGERRPLRAIQVTERWARGQATVEEVRAARDAADAAAAAADAYAAADAAAAAAYAAAAADAAAAAAAYAYAYADAAADAAAAYADAAAARSRKRSAALVRKRIPWRVIKACLDGGAR